jgi:hypothetical protein
VGRRSLCRPSRLDNHDVAGVRLIDEPAVPEVAQVGYFFPWFQENRRPIMHFTTRWSVEGVVPIPTPKVKLPCWSEIDVDRGEELLQLIS